MSVTLKEWATDIGNAIREVEGTTELIPAQEMPSRIRALNKNSGTVSGTPVPNNEYIEKVYFNTSLSRQEVINILKTLPYVQTPIFQHPIYPILISSDNTPIIMAVQILETYYEILYITDSINEIYEYIFMSYAEEEYIEISKESYDVNKTVIPNFMGIEIGTLNDTLTNLVSITPFPVTDINITANGEYDVTDYKKAIVNVASDDFELIKKLLGKEQMQEFEIPYGVTTLGRDSLTGFKTTTLILPQTITFIAGYVANDSNLSERSIYYKGTLNEWLKMTKGLENKQYSSSYNLFGGSTYTKKYYNLYINNEKINDITLENVEIGNYSLASIHLNNLYIKKNLTLFKEYQYSFQYNNLIGLCDGAFIENVFVDYDESVTKTDFYNRMFENATITNLVYNEGHTEIFISNSGVKCTTITLPSTLTKLDTRYTTKCTTCYINASNPPVISSIVDFSDFSKIWVPKGTSATYKSATNWSKYASKIYERINVAFNIDSSLLNNANVTYSIDNGSFQQFNSTSFALENIATLVVKNADSTKTIKVGTTAGGNELATISNTTTSINITTDTTIYISVQ